MARSLEPQTFQIRAGRLCRPGDFAVDWQSDETAVLVSPHLSEAVVQQLKSVAWPDLPGHLWLATSGTSSTEQIKMVALSKAALLHSARSVNEHLQVESRDSWMLTLPLFHVGGLAILARAHLMGNTVHSLDDWSAQSFVHWAEAQETTLSSLVPTQVYDLVTEERRCPKSLRAVVVGGGALTEDLYQRARQLGWPLLPSYGLTECASQVATAVLDSLNRVPPPATEETLLPGMKLLRHVEVEAQEDDRLVIRSDSLYTGYLTLSAAGSKYLPRPGALLTEDLGRVENGELVIMGRCDQQQKVSGELVNQASLQRILEETLSLLRLPLDGVILLLPDARRGHSVNLVLSVELMDTADSIVQALHSRLRPFERCQGVYYIDSLPKTALGKWRLEELRSTLGY